MKKWNLLGLLLLVLIAAGCGKQTVQPVDITEGVDRCVVCNMLIEDGPHATELFLKDGKVLKFDDLGDMYKWTKQNGTDQVEQRFVRDFNTKEWVRIEDAGFVYDKNYRTPMAFGVYSFKSAQDAQAYIDRQKTGKLLTLADLDTHSWERNMDMMKEMKQKHGMGSNNMNSNNMNNMNSDSMKSDNQDSNNQNHSMNMQNSH
ncbi:nitrous oxide reductase accessory protein NosL [Ferviditalea candida]|uniref:Nitrous oxide reductase accessory protein NosL n=1 Tax=Ferviditalea candida TaxID=3108399 RepID=A0ABU5ZJG0_9BACL|nr:nitrous oxide reductase accessory protein NosL [Paenibacillaceae bacterium T2]